MPSKFDHRAAPCLSVALGWSIAAGPERIALQDAAAKASEEAAAAQRRVALGLDPDEPDPVAVGAGARCCDEVLFGKGVYERVRTSQRKRIKRRGGATYAAVAES